MNQTSASAPSLRSQDDRLDQELKLLAERMSEFASPPELDDLARRLGEALTASLQAQAEAETAPKTPA